MFPLFIFDQVNEEIDGAVEGCQKVTEAGDQVNPVWPVINLQNRKITFILKYPLTSQGPVKHNSQTKTFLSYLNSCFEIKLR